MTHLLEKAGASFLRAFGASLVVLAPGLLGAPNFNGAKLLAVSAVFSALTAGLKAIQIYAPQVTFASILPQPFAAWVDSFARAFLGSFIAAVAGVLSVPNFGTAKALLVAALVGAVAAGFRAVQGVTTRGETPAPAKGLTPPASTPAV